MKQTDNKHSHAEHIIVINGDNNKVSVYEIDFQKLFVVAIIIVIATSVLAVSIICPKQLSDYIRCIIEIAMSR